MAGKMLRRLCLLMGILLSQEIQCGNAHSAYYSRKQELGYFDMDLLVVTKSSGIECATACSLADGCSVISYSRNQKLCRLSRGVGQYVADTNWETYLLHVWQQALQGQVTSELSNIVTVSSAFSGSIRNLTEIPRTVVTPGLTGSTVSNGMEIPHSEIVKMSYTSDTMVTSSSTDQRAISVTNAGALTSQTGDMATAISTTASPIFAKSTTEIPPPTQGDLIECPKAHIFKATPSGSCFHVSDASREMFKATLSCERHGGHLATISNELENQELIQMLPSNGSLTTNVLIGATYSDTDGEWTWVTGEIFTWIGSAPANHDQAAGCLAYSFSNSWEWISVLCTERYHSVCEIDP